jgi:hypothetical protein
VGATPEGSPHSAVPALGIDVRKVIAHHNNPVQSVLAFLEQHPADLIVLAMHQHEGHSRWLQLSVAAPIARQSGQMTLFIPHGVEGFVSRRWQEAMNYAIGLRCRRTEGLRLFLRASLGRSCMERY